MVLVLVTGCVLSVAGALRLGDAIARASTQWVGNPLLGDALAGVVLMMLPLIAIVLMWRYRRR